MYWTFIGLCIVLTACILAGFQALKKILVNNMVRAMQKKDFKLYFEILESTPMRVCYAKFNRIYMTLNGAMLQQNKELINSSVDKLLSMRLNKRQANNAYLYAFYYYINEGNKEYSVRLLDKIQSFGTDALIKSCKQEYSILVLKEANYINSMKRQLQECDDVYRQGYLSYMIGLQYENIMDKENSASYLGKAWDILKGTSYEGNIAGLMGKGM